MVTTPNEQIVSPMFQTFFVSDSLGIYITKIGLFFGTKSSKDSITLSIRDAFKSGNTSPNRHDVMPGSEVTLTKAQVSVDATGATAETIFEFDEPVYLAPQKMYAIALESNDGLGYQLWASQAGDFNLGTTTSRVTTDPVAGTLFRSQGGINKLPEGNSDLKYKIYRAKFKSNTGTLVLKDANPPSKRLINNPFTTTSGSKVIRVAHPHHGFQVNDKVTFAGLTSGTSYNGITGSNILGDRVITQIDATGYKFTAGGATNASSTGRTGGASVNATRQYVFDTAKLAIDSYIPGAAAKIEYKGDFVTSSSYADGNVNEVAYATTSDILLQAGKDITFDQPHVVLTDTNETLHFSGAESTTITATLSSLVGGNKTSPYIDLQRASMITMNNLVDKQDSAASVGFSNPMTFVPETHPKNGTELAKHITKPVTLEEAANGLKVNFAAHCPINGEINAYYRTTQVGRDSDIQELNWNLIPYDETPPKDQDRNVFREYEANLGGEYYNSLPHFDQYQLKLVLRSQSSSKVPRIRDLRTIALAADTV